ncbi:lipopolysaccharide biosynthesis protein [Persicobacter psychrovividus]|uniref:Polysaccharide biosynthesis protein n=1 Tax=Persicobacter psychrovividus TaxID=387638 RepID=A0ABM7VF31_9BACT|nr:hypothetical protein PEPS_18340 [Persicobacter psychrovividus]
MGIVVKQGVRASLMTYFGVIFGALNFLYFMPKVLAPDQIGMVRLLQDLGMLLASFLQFGLPTVLDRFIPTLRKQPMSIPKFALLYPLPLIGLFLCFFWLAPDYWARLLMGVNPEMMPYFYLVPVLMILMIYQLMMESFYRANLNIVFSAFTKEVFLRISLSLLIGGVALSWIGFHELMYGLVGAYAVAVLLLIIYAQLKGWLNWQGKVLPPVSERKPMLHFAWFVILSSAGALVSTKVDSLMISSMIGLDALGVYVIAFFIGTVIEIPRRAISQIAIPLISKAFKSDDFEGIEKLYQQTTGILAVVASWLFLGIWCNIDVVYQLMPNSEIYKAGAMVVFWVGLSKVVDMIFGLNSEIILQSPKYKWVTYFTVVLAFLLVVTNLLMIPAFGIAGAACATFLSMLIYNLLKFRLILHEWHFQPFTKNTLYFLPFPFIAYALVLLLPQMQWLVLFTLRGVMITTVLYVGAIISGVSMDINRFHRRYVLRQQ